MVARALNPPAAIAQDRIARLERAELAELHRRLSYLTPREREVLPLVVSGLLNKQAAAELGIGVSSGIVRNDTRAVAFRGEASIEGSAAICFRGRTSCNDLYGAGPDSRRCSTVRPTAPTEHRHGARR